jgi:hypothetical protein
LAVTAPTAIVADGDERTAMWPILNVGATISAGATIRLFRKFSVRSMADSYEADRITVGIVVAPIAAALAQLPDLDGYDLGSLRYLNWSATPVNAEIARRLTGRIRAGWEPAYGTTEVPILAVTPLDVPGNARLDSVGRPPAGVEMEAADPATGALLERGEPGELVARSPAAGTAPQGVQGCAAGQDPGGEQILKEADGRPVADPGDREGPLEQGAVRFDDRQQKNDEAQNPTACAAPGTDHFSSLRCPITSVSWVSASRPACDRAYATRSGVISRRCDLSRIMQARW